MFNRILSIFRKIPVTITAPVSAPATDASLSWAVAKGALLLYLQNAPPSLSQLEYEKIVLAALEKPLASRPVSFTLDPAQAGDAAYRLILALNPARSLSADQLARGVFHTEDNGKGGLRLLLILAHQEQALTWVEGRLGRCDGAQDPAFATLLRQAMRDLLAHLSP